MKGGLGRSWVWGGVGWGGVGVGCWVGWGGYGSRCVNDGAGQRAGLSPGSTRNYGLFTINISSVVRSGHTLYADSTYKLHLACGQVRQDSTWFIADYNQSVSTLWSINFNFRVSADQEAVL
jgi:hypothetical protein